MANKAYDYDFTLIRTKRADGKATTIALKSDHYFALVKRYPDRKARQNAVALASLEYDALPVPRPTRTAYIRRKLVC